MSCKKSAIECAVSARCRSVCAAWLVAAAGASEGLGQDRDPFDGTTSPDSTVEVSEAGQASIERRRRYWPNVVSDQRLDRARVAG